MKRTLALVALLTVVATTGCTSYRAHVSTMPPIRGDVYIDGVHKGTTSSDGTAVVESGTRSIYPFPLLELRKEDYRGSLNLSFASSNRKKNERAKNVLSVQHRKQVGRFVQPVRYDVVFDTSSVSPIESSTPPPLLSNRRS